MAWEFDFLYFLQGLHQPWLDEWMAGITALADHGMVWVVTALVFLCFKKSRIIGISMLAAMALSFVTGNLFLKNVIARNRPCWIDKSAVLLIANPEDFSFPSGHTLVSFTSAVSIFLRNRRWGIAALALASLIAFSRLYLFVHFPTDILGGILLGTASALVVKWLLTQARDNRMQKKRRQSS